MRKKSIFGKYSAQLWILFGLVVGTTVGLAQFSGVLSARDPAVPASASSPNVWFETFNLVKDMVPGIGSPNPYTACITNEKLYFTSITQPLQLWKTDGTDLGTVLVAPLLDGRFPEGQIVELSGNLYFLIRTGDQVYDVALWKSDGSTQGTKKISDPRISCSSGVCLWPFGSTLYFPINDPIYGYEFGKLDNSSQAPVLIKDINPGGGGSFPDNFTILNGIGYFAANDGVHGLELWRTDGSEEGTQLVKDIYPGSGFGIEGNQMEVNFVPGQNQLFFVATTPEEGTELWVSDGTITGTVLVKDIYPGVSSSNSGGFVWLDGAMYFSAYDGVHGYELWKSDGSLNGTRMVKDIYPGAISSWAGGLTVFNHKVYFSADDSINGNELWVTDGSEIGTQMVMDINTYSTGYYFESHAYPSNLTVFHNSLYFSATYDRKQNMAIYKMDANSDPYAILNTKDPQFFAHNNQSLFFVVLNDAVLGRELWMLETPRRIYFPLIQR